MVWQFGEPEYWGDVLQEGLQEGLWEGVLEVL